MRFHPRLSIQSFLHIRAQGEGLCIGIIRTLPLAEIFAAETEPVPPARHRTLFRERHRIGYIRMRVLFLPHIDLAHIEVGSRKAVRTLVCGIDKALEAFQRKGIFIQIEIGFAHNLRNAGIGLDFKRCCAGAYYFLMPSKAEKAPAFDNIGLYTPGILGEFRIADSD